MDVGDELVEVSGVEQQGEQVGLAALVLHGDEVAELLLRVGELDLLVGDVGLELIDLGVGLVEVVGDAHEVVVGLLGGGVERVKLRLGLVELGLELGGRGGQGRHRDKPEPKGQHDCGGDGRAARAK